MNKISHVQKREIQAPVVTRILKKFIEEFGEEDTLRVLSKVIEEDAIDSGKELARKYKGNEIKELASMIREVWCEDGAMEIEVLKKQIPNFTSMFPGVCMLKCIEN